MKLEKFLTVYLDDNALQDEFGRDADAVYSRFEVTDAHTQALLAEDWAALKTLGENPETLRPLLERTREQSLEVTLVYPRVAIRIDKIQAEAFQPGQPTTVRMSVVWDKDKQPNRIPTSHVKIVETDARFEASYVFIDFKGRSAEIRADVQFPEKGQYSLAFSVRNIGVSIPVNVTIE